MRPSDHHSASREPVPDLWGRIMLDFHVGMPALYGIRRDDGHLSDGHSPEVYFGDPEQFFPWEEDLLDAVQGPVLDVGAGPGRMALWAQAQGFEVVALESSPLTVAISAERGVSDVRCGRWEAFDEVLLPQERAFGSVLLMGHNFGLAGTLDGLRTMLQSLRDRTRPGATVIGSSIEFTDSDDPEHLRYHELRRAQGRYPGEMVIGVEYEGLVGTAFPMLLVDTETLGHIAFETGWQIDRIVRSDELPYGAVLRRLG